MNIIKKYELYNYYNLTSYNYKQNIGYEIIYSFIKKIDY